jgi:alkylation response protein AidB-like acyl-CoA dehydrogenase
MVLNDSGQLPLIATVIFPSDMDEIRLTMREDGEKLMLNGRSPLIGNATLARFFFVFAYEDRDGDDLTCILIDRQSQDIVFGEEAGLPGLKVNPFAPIIFHDVEITPERIVGTRREARAIYEKALDAYHGFIAACSMGAARAAYSKALKYAKDRYQFGAMIIQHQEIQRMLGSMLAKLAVGTSSYIAALNREDYGIVYGVAKNRFSKVFCTDAALEIAIDAVQIHGGYGYMHDYGVEKIMRDVKVLQLLGESNPVVNIKSMH